MVTELKQKRVQITITYLHSKDVKIILMDVLNPKGLEEGIVIQLAREGHVVTLPDIYGRTHIEFAHAIQDMVLEAVENG